MAKLNVARCYSSACTLNDYIFVIAGQDEQDPILNSIEKLSLSDVSKGIAVWTLIQPKLASFPHRILSAVVPLNSEEIAVLGGYHYGFLNDIYIFDARTE